jgi:hypothetical protein
LFCAAACWFIENGRFRWAEKAALNGENDLRDAWEVFPSFHRLDDGATPQTEPAQPLEDFF